jgi:hypothetical protein
MNPWTSWKYFGLKEKQNKTFNTKKRHQNVLFSILSEPQNMYTSDQGLVRSFTNIENSFGDVAKVWRNIKMCKPLI